MRFDYFLRFLKGMFLLQIFIVIIMVGVSMDISRQIIPGFAGLKLESLLIPFVNIEINEGQASNLFREVNYLLAGTPNTAWSQKYLNNQNPENLLAANIPVLAYANNSLDEPITSVPEEKQPSAVKKTIPVLINKENSKLFKGRKVFFYCTHSGETYISDSGKANLDGKRGLINAVAKKIADKVSEKGLQAVYIDTIHDFPEYDRSYTNSRKTINDIISSQENIMAIFDIHRDSILGEKKGSVKKINGQKSAQILIVVGTDQRKSHPNWRENLKFAEKIYAQAEKMYPGLVRGVRTQAGTYNQEFHNHALLLEMGSDRNSLAEANYAGELFSEVLVEVLKEEL